jgi:hypothetical protein
VRDSTGIPVPDLKKEDFRLYDKGKLQTITNFAVETPESRKKAALAKFTKQIGENPAETSEKALPPDHFVAVMLVGFWLCPAAASAKKYEGTRRISPNLIRIVVL